MSVQPTGFPQICLHSSGSAHATSSAQHYNKNKQKCIGSVIVASVENCFFQGLIQDLELKGSDALNTTDYVIKVPV